MGRYRRKLIVGSLAHERIMIQCCAIWDHSSSDEYGVAGNLKAKYVYENSRARFAKLDGSPLALPNIFRSSTNLIRYILRYSSSSLDRRKAFSPAAGKKKELSGEKMVDKTGSGFGKRGSDSDI